jgi:mono/diheme cytochrome c family protein
VTALAHCDECHTPRNGFGALDMTRRLAGAALAGDESAPNVSPDTFKGIGNWRKADLVRYLSKGVRPDEEFADGAMAEVIDNGLAHLRAEDIEAMAEYLLSLPPRTN